MADCEAAQTQQSNEGGGGLRRPPMLPDAQRVSGGASANQHDEDAGREGSVHHGGNKG
jgi:hypothetical protein